MAQPTENAQYLNALLWREKKNFFFQSVIHNFNTFENFKLTFMKIISITVTLIKEKIAKTNFILNNISN